MKKKYSAALTAAELEALDDSDIDLSEIPEMTEEMWKNAKVVWPERIEKTQVTAKFDREVVEWFKGQGRGYQTRMNAVLRSYYEAHRDR